MPTITMASTMAHADVTTSVRFSLTWRERLRAVLPAPDAIPTLFNSFARPPGPISQTESMIRGRVAQAPCPLDFARAKLGAYAAAQDVSATSRYSHDRASQPRMATHRAFSRSDPSSTRAFSCRVPSLSSSGFSSPCRHDSAFRTHNGTSPKRQD